MLTMLFHQLIVSNLKVSLCTTAALFFFQFSAFGVGHYIVLRCFIVNVFFCTKLRKIVARFVACSRKL